MEHKIRVSNYIDYIQNVLKGFLTFQAFFWFFFVVLFFTFESKAKPSILIKDGILDAGKITFDRETSTAPLKGKWFFYWDNWVPAESFRNEIPDKPSLMNVSGNWHHFKDPKTGKDVGPFGKATYTLKIRNILKGNSFSSLSGASLVHINCILLIRMGFDYGKM